MSSFPDRNPCPLAEFGVSDYRWDLTMRFGGACKHRRRRVDRRTRGRRWTPMCQKDGDPDRGRRAGILTDWR
jgi:hypothetical protein